MSPLLPWRQLATALRLPDTGSLPRTELHPEAWGPPGHGHTSEGMRRLMRPFFSSPLVLSLHPAHLDGVGGPLASKGANPCVPGSAHLRHTHCPQPLCDTHFLSVSGARRVLTTSSVLRCTPPLTHAGRAAEMGSVASSQEGRPHNTTAGSQASDLQTCPAPSAFAHQPGDRGWIFFFF